LSELSSLYCVQTPSPPSPPTAFQRLVCGWAASGRWDGVMSSVARDPERQAELRQSVPLGVEQLLVTLQRKGVLQRWTRENCAAVSPSL